MGKKQSNPPPTFIKPPAPPGPPKPFVGKNSIDVSLAVTEKAQEQVKELVAQHFFQQKADELLQLLDTANISNADIDRFIFMLNQIQKRREVKDNV